MTPQPRKLKSSSHPPPSSHHQQLCRLAHPSPAVPRHCRSIILHHRKPRYRRPFPNPEPTHPTPPHSQPIIHKSITAAQPPSTPALSQPHGPSVTTTCSAQILCHPTAAAHPNAAAVAVAPFIAERHHPSRHRHRDHRPLPPLRSAPTQSIDTVATTIDASQPTRHLRDHHRHFPPSAVCAHRSLCSVPPFSSRCSTRDTC